MKKIKGSMTIEITLLMPVLIGVFLFLFFTAYYLHDEAAYEKACNAALLRGALAVTGNGQDAWNGQAEMEKAFEEIRILGKWAAGHSIQLDGAEISVRISGTMEAPEGLLRKLTKREYKLENSREHRRIDEVIYIRSMKRDKQVNK